MLTPHQQQALRLDTHLCVTANAGSGKTLVLVERYLEIIVGGAAITGEILAMTFTEKAASELKRKIAENISLRLGGPLQASERTALERARDQLPSAIIDTIHGFCSRILHEFPVEAGVDASFTVLEGIDKETLLQESLRETFRRILRDGSDPLLKSRFLDALRTVGKGTCIRILETLGRKRELAERLTGPSGIYNASDEEVLQHWQDLLASRLESLLADEDLLTDLRVLLDTAKGKAALQARELLPTVRSAPTLIGKGRALGAILGAALTKDGTVSRTFLGRGIAYDNPRRFAGCSRRLSPLLAALSDPAGGEQHRRLLSHTRTLLALHGLAAERYTEKKNAAARLDFDDLQILTRELLRKEFVRSRLAARYKFIMVDEYQDTNRLQYEILLPLVNNLASGNLFIVGDPKQSIYGFRNADVAVFEQTRRDIRDQGGDDVVLGESFRPLGNLAAFTNTLFGPLMGRGGHGAVPYNELLPARNNTEPGRVEILLLPDDADSLPTGEAVARRIRALHVERLTVFDRTEHPRPMRFGDVAILLRSRTHLGEIEQALIRQRIPHVVTGGTGYFQTQTVYDFYNYFRFLLHPADDVALAGILRSPFFSVSDVELFEAAGMPRIGSLWDHLRAYTDRRAFPALDRALGMLETDLAETGRRTVTELLARLVDRTAIEAVWAAVPGGDQAAANLRKLEGIARTHERRGFVTLHDFTMRLKRLVEEEQKEGQASVDLRQDAVQILTVHGAKGLEFPVVIVPLLERPFRFDAQPFLSEELGLGFSTAEEMAPVAELMKQESRARSVAEEQRIFYVACTRARDCLVLCGRSEAGTGERWMSWLTAAVPLSPDSPPCIEIPASLTLHTPGHPGPVEQPHTLVLHLLRETDLPEQPLPTAASPPGGTPLRIAVEPIVRPPRGVIFSATQIRTYLECPALYYLRYVLGFRTGHAGGGGEVDAEDADRPLDPELRGTIIHRALERCAGAAADATEAIVHECAAAEGAPPARAGELARIVRSVTGSDFWKVMERSAESRTEFSLTAALDDHFVTGTLDRIFRDADGLWHIVDFKTDSLLRSAPEDKTTRYLSQLKLYALLAAGFYRCGEIRGSLLFTARPDSPHTFTFTKGELREFEDSVREVVRRINRNDFNALQYPCPSCPRAPEGCSRFFATGPLFPNG